MSGAQKSEEAIQHLEAAQDIDHTSEAVPIRQHIQGQAVHLLRLSAGGPLLVKIRHRT